MAHWSHGVTDILKSHSGDLKKLAELAGEDWKYIYRGQSLAGCDLSGQDLRGMDLTGCEIERATLDANTITDIEFDPRIGSHAIYRDFRIPSELDRIVQSFAKDASYVYAGWAYKALIDHFAVIYKTNRLDVLISQIAESGEFGDLVSHGYHGKKKLRSILVTPYQQYVLRAASLDFPQFRIDSLSLFVGALSRKLIRSRKRSLVGLTTTAIWPDVDF